MSMELPANGMTRVYNENGQTCIPKEVRDELGIKSGDEFRVIADDGEVRFVPNDDDGSRWEDWSK